MSRTSDLTRRASISARSAGISRVTLCILATRFVTRGDPRQPKRTKGCALRGISLPIA
jgi:hypothetical protein